MKLFNHYKYNKFLFLHKNGKDISLYLKKTIMTEKEKVWFDSKRQKEEKKQIDNYYNDVRAIRKNVQYFFWLSIISIISTIIFLLF